MGLRTIQPESLKELIEGKFVDALRSVAAGMTMSQLHEQRADFVQKVQQVSAAPPDLRSVGRGREAPAALAELVARNLAKDPLDRSPNARAFGAELSACLFAGRQDTSITTRLLGDSKP